MVFKKKSIGKVIGDLLINWLTRIVLLKPRTIHLEVLVASVPMSIIPYGYTFFTLKGPDHLEWSFPRNNFNREWKRRTKSSS